MTSGFYGSEDFGNSPFDDFLARIYGTGGPRQPAHRVDITRLMSAPARELLGAAAAHVAERGGANQDTEQLLWAAAHLEPTRELLARLVPDRPVFGSLLAQNVSDQLGGVRLNAIQILIPPSAGPANDTPTADCALRDAFVASPADLSSVDQR